MTTQSYTYQFFASAWSEVHRAMIDGNTAMKRVAIAEILWQRIDAGDITPFEAAQIWSQWQPSLGAPPEEWTR